MQFLISGDKFLGQIIHMQRLKALSMQDHLPANVLKVGRSLHFGKQLFTRFTVRSDCNFSTCICNFDYLYFCCGGEEMLLVFAYLLFSKPNMLESIYCLYWLLTLLQPKYLKCYMCM